MIGAWNDKWKRNNTCTKTISTGKVKNGKEKNTSIN